MNTLKEIEGRYYKQCKVVMLPTDRATWPNCIWLGRMSKRLKLDTSYNHIPKSIPPIDNSMLPQHLYITSQDKIQEGDYFIHDKNPIHLTVSLCTDVSHLDYRCRKIIATTDKLCTGMTEGNVYYTFLPTPSHSFIKAYIDAYNNDNPIVDVLVEYEKGFLMCKHCKAPYPYEANDGKCATCRKSGLGIMSKSGLKVDPNNNITIKKIKDNYTREEVIKLCDRSYRYGWDGAIAEERDYRSQQHDCNSLNNWIKENL